jgi:PAS domain-containing protein
MTATGEPELINRRIMEYKGRNFDDFKGWLKMVSPEDVEAGARAWNHSMTTGEPFDFEFRFRRADGVYRWFESRAQPIQDHGIGLEDQERIFEGFFTTKENGMGLAICRSIFEAHHVRLWPTSGEGLGTTFVFTLPVYSKAPE